MQNCGSCERAWTGKDGRVHCGAPVDDFALAGGEGVNPIWAERKYSSIRIGLMLLGQPTNDKGIDCENMDPADGANCKVFKARL